MNDILLIPRSFSLRILVVTTFAVPLIVGLVCLISGFNMAVPGVVLIICTALLYVAMVAQAIDDDRMASTVSMIMLVGSLIAAFNSIYMLSEFPDPTQSIVNGIFSGRDEFGEWMVSTIQKSSIYGLLSNGTILGALIYGFKSVSKRFTFTWIVLTIGQVIGVLGSFYMFMYASFDTYTKCSNISAILGAVFFIALFIAGGKKKESETVGSRINKDSVHIDNPERDNNTQNKTEQLFKLKELLDSGILTQEEFNIEKTKILNQ